VKLDEAAYPLKLDEADVPVTLEEEAYPVKLAWLNLEKLNKCQAPYWI